MNVEEIRNYCLSLGSDVEEKLPFVMFKNGEGVLVFYVCGHMFCFFDLNDFQVISLKCQPERIATSSAIHTRLSKPNIPRKNNDRTRKNVSRRSV